ncbi:MAG: phage tail assembly chaperone [Burkholderia gladioli]
MLKIEEVIYCISKIYPDARAGKDFWVVEPLNEDYTQKSDAVLIDWKFSQPEPTQEQINAVWSKDESEYRQEVALREATTLQKQKIDDATALVESAIDQGDAEKEKIARAYRQALRDVSAQPGFSAKIIWPDVPKL